LTSALKQSQTINQLFSTEFRLSETKLTLKKSFQELLKEALS